MTQPRAARAAAAAGQVAVGVGAHTSASGCPPSLSGLAFALPLALAGVLILGRALPSRTLVRLGGGQLAVHAAMTAAAACDSAHSPHLLMTYAHVAAAVLLRAGWDRVARVLDDARRAAGRLVPRLRLLAAAPLCATRPPVVLTSGRDAPVRLLLPAPTGRRGPPDGRFVLTPA